MIRPGTEFQIIPRCHPRCSSNKEPLSSPANVGNTCGPQPDLSGSNRQLRSVAQLRLSQPGFQSVTRSLCWTPWSAVFISAFAIWIFYGRIIRFFTFPCQWSFYTESVSDFWLHTRKFYARLAQRRGPRPRTRIIWSEVFHDAELERAGGLVPLLSEVRPGG